MISVLCSLELVRQRVSLRRGKFASVGIPTTFGSATSVVFLPQVDASSGAFVRVMTFWCFDKGLNKSAKVRRSDLLEWCVKASFGTLEAVVRIVRARNVECGGWTINHLKSQLISTLSQNILTHNFYFYTVLLSTLYLFPEFKSYFHNRHSLPLLRPSLHLPVLLRPNIQPQLFPDICRPYRSISYLLPPSIMRPSDRLKQ
jgi:hypothetical protein